VARERDAASRSRARRQEGVLALGRDFRYAPVFSPGRTPDLANHRLWRSRVAKVGLRLRLLGGGANLALRKPGRRGRAAEPRV